MANVVITLNVQARNLWNLTNPTQAQIDSCCSLSDNNLGTSPNGTIEDFTTPAQITNNIKWVGVTGDYGFTVAIDSISYENEGDDVNVFDFDTIQGTGGRSGNVNANVKNDRSLIGWHDDYLIRFSIYDTPTEMISFSIDPKIQINP